jgi:hypothetical protein
LGGPRADYWTIVLAATFSRLTYANVIATLALFVALGGTAAAGAHVWITGANVRNGSLTGRDVANRSLSAKKLKLRTVTGALVRDGSLRTADFNQDDLKALVGTAGATGPAGPAGPAGAKGDEGKKGDPGSSDIVRDAASGSSATNYANDDVLLSHAVPADGGWLVWAQLDVTNTSASGDWFNCGVFVDGQQLGGGGTNDLPAGTTMHINTVGFGPAGPGQPVDLWCEHGGAGTFDVANVTANFAKIM